MFELKPLTPDGVEAALSKAEHYRLLNEAWEAESICREPVSLRANRRTARPSGRKAQRGVWHLPRRANLSPLHASLCGEGIEVQKVRADRQI